MSQRLLNFQKPSLALRLTTSGLILAGLLSLGACAPTLSHQGYLAVDHDPAKDVKVGDSLDSVQEKLGSPSQTASFDPNIWYFIDQTTQKMTYKPAMIKDRRVTIVEFDKGMEKVTSVKTLTIADSRDIKPNKNETPTRGRAMTALEQILGTVGRQSLTREGENPAEQQRRRE